MENITINAGAEQIISELEANGFKAYITGGAIIEYLLDMPVSSVHISTSASPEQISALFPDTVNVNHKTKTVIVLKNQTGYEISTFRRAPSTFGEHADVYDDLYQKVQSLCHHICHYLSLKYETILMLLLHNLIQTLHQDLEYL